MQVSSDIQTILTSCGKAEFLAHGFEKASLRVICRNAGVTTGAFYSHFKSKDELLRVILESDLGDVRSAVEAFAIPETHDADALAKAENDFVMFGLAHRDSVKLLLDGAEGSSFSHYGQDLFERFHVAVRNFLDARETGFDPDVVYMVARIEYQRCLELFSCDYDESSVRKAIAALTTYATAGLRTFA